jgi:hypothetical protein
MVQICRLSFGWHCLHGQNLLPTAWLNYLQGKNWNCPLSFLGDIKMKNLSWSDNSIEAWLDRKDVQAGLALALFQQWKEFTDYRICFALLQIWNSPIKVQGIQ